MIEDVHNISIHDLYMIYHIPRMLDVSDSQYDRATDIKSLILCKTVHVVFVK